MNRGAGLVAAAAIGLLAACAKHQPFAGDGRLIDHGVTAPDQRYEIEFGPVDLSRVGTTHFRMRGLPDTYFVVGLQFPRPADAGGTAAPTTPADVSIQVYQENHGMAALVTTPLRDLKWLPSKQKDSVFAYLPQSPRSYFDAFSEARYQLTVTVNVPDPALPRGALAVLKSAGWK